jgi:hypothetical protein
MNKRLPAKVVSPLDCELLGLRFARRVAEVRKISADFHVRLCDCGAASLLVDLEKTPESERPLLHRLARKFSKRAAIQYSNDLGHCPACGVARGEAVEHRMSFGPRGVEINEVRLPGRAVDVLPGGLLAIVERSGAKVSTPQVLER